MDRRLALLLAFFASALSGAADEAGPALRRVAFGSCNREDKPQPLWQPIQDCRPDLWLWLGDIVYGRADDLKGLARKYDKQKEQPGYRALRSQCRVLGVWDDNDYGVSDGGKKNANKNESQRLLLDFLDEPPGSERRRREGMFAASTFGPPGRQVKVIFLDGRTARDEPGRKGDVLGAGQWRWLEEQLTHSKADVHLIGSGIQVIASEHPFEKWADFPQARQRLFALLAKTQPKNIIFLSGDRHLGEISRLRDARFSQPLYDITSSGLTHHATNTIFHNFRREKNRYRCGQNLVDLNFGLVLFDWESTPPVATLQIRDAANTVRAEEKVILSVR